jgi:hypothetical protein
MKKFYSMVIAAIMAVFSFSAQAEAPYLDAFAGLNFTTIDHSGVNYRVGVHLGIRGTLDMPSVAKGFYTNAAAMFTYTGFKLDSINYSPVSLVFPIHAGYKYELDLKKNLFIEAGPYFSIGLFGKSEGRNVFSKEVGYKRFDAGLGLRAGLDLNEKWIFSVGGDFGFINRLDIKRTRTSTVMASIGYRL